MFAGIGFAGLAQAQYAYPPYAGYGYYGQTAAPQSWSYDPYTNGMASCVQWDPHDPESCARLVPSYGQPSYAPWGSRW